MSLGISSGGGGGNGADRVPVVKYDARAGRIFRLDRTQDAGGNWSSNNVEITDGFQAIFDLENIEVGWLNFPAGNAPEMTLVKLGQPIPPKPSDRHKQGFRLLMKLGKSIGGDVREMASNTGMSIGAMDALHSAYEADRAANPGKLPVVGLESTTAHTSTGKDKDGRAQTSTNYAPVWTIVAWVPRPAELGGTAGAPNPAPLPPAPKPKAAPAVANEF